MIGKLRKLFKVSDVQVDEAQENAVLPRSLWFARNHWRVGSGLDYDHRSGKNKEV